MELLISTRFGSRRNRRHDPLDLALGAYIAVCAALADHMLREVAGGANVGKAIRALGDKTC